MDIILDANLRVFTYRTSNNCKIKEHQHHFESQPVPFIYELELLLRLSKKETETR